MLKVAPKVLPGLWPQNHTPFGWKRREEPSLFSSASRERQSLVTPTSTSLGGSVPRKLSGSATQT